MCMPQAGGHIRVSYMPEHIDLTGKGLEISSADAARLHHLDSMSSWTMKQCSCNLFMSGSFCKGSLHHWIQRFGLPHLASTDAKIAQGELTCKSVQSQVCVQPLQLLRCAEVYLLCTACTS